MNRLCCSGKIYSLFSFFFFKDLYMEPAGAFLFCVRVCVSALHFLSVVPEFRNNRLQLTGLRRGINKGQRRKYFLRLFFFLTTFFLTTRFTHQLLFYFCFTAASPPLQWSVRAFHDNLVPPDGCEASVPLRRQRRSRSAGPLVVWWYFNGRGFLLEWKRLCWRLLGLRLLTKKNSTTTTTKKSPFGRQQQCTTPSEGRSTAGTSSMKTNQWNPFDF